MAIALDERLLDEKLAELEKVRGWSPRTISKLEALVRAGDDLQLFKVNPLKFAKEKNVEETEAVDLFLYASKLGIFQMTWNLICPNCGDSVESLATLRDVGGHFFCVTCQVGRQVQFDDFIHISFTVSPRIREIPFHHPERLSIEDYYLKYRFSPDAKLPDGTPFLSVVRSLTKVLSYVEPGETKSWELDLTPGTWVGHDLWNAASFVFEVGGEPAADLEPASFAFDGSRFTPAEGRVRPGRVRLTMENRSGRRGSLLSFIIPPGYVPSLLTFDPFLSGKRLLTTQTFRDLFESETIRGTEGIGVRSLTLLFTDLKGSTALYDRIGDLKAFALVQSHFQCLRRAVGRHEGAIVKTIGDAIMASFRTEEGAVLAALDMLKEIEAFNQENGARELILKIGIHTGPTIAVTLNDRLDYFGQAVNIAARVQGLAGAEEIVLTDDVYRAEPVRSLLADRPHPTYDAKLKGVERPVRVHRLSPPGRAADREAGDAGEGLTPAPVGLWARLFRSRSLGA